MIADARNVIDDLRSHGLQKAVICRVHRASEHEIMPQQDAVPVAEIIKLVVFIDPSSPHAQHVHVRLGCRADHKLAPLRRHAILEIILRNVIGSFHENRHAVQADEETRPKRVMVPHDFQ